MELIKLPTELGLEVKRILEEKGTSPRLVSKGKFKGMLSLEFTQEELDSITKLVITSPNNRILNGIENLRNLEYLSISTKGVTAYKKSPQSITDNNIKAISKLKKLKYLLIDNQSDITWVLLDGLQNLEEIHITRNPRLDEIDGLDKLYKVKWFEENGNKELYLIDGIQSLIENNNLDYIGLDILHFPEIICKRNKLIAEKVDCDFLEQICNIENKTIGYTFYPTSVFHNKCQQIADEAKSISNNVWKQILYVEKYLAENITYDYEAINIHDRTHFEYGIQRGKRNGTNSAYNGIMYGSAVCEGYTRSMQYILKIMGIKTKNVYCIAGNDKIIVDKYNHNQIILPNYGYHSIIRIDFDDKIYYFDPCWDSVYWQHGDKTLSYSYLTKEEMSLDHTLSFEEDDVIYNVPFNRKEIEFALKDFNCMSR